MFEQISSLDAADKKTRNQWPREGATIFAVVEVALWGLLLYALRFVVEK
jgi:hypothetical protein